LLAAQAHAAALPRTCPARTASAHSSTLWEAVHWFPGVDTALMEVRWIPDAAAGAGHIECSYATDRQHFAHFPTLRSRFAVLPPDGPGWVRASQREDWWLCSPAPGEPFRADRCSFDAAAEITDTGNLPPG
jgi:hypothetical protein